MVSYADCREDDCAVELIRYHVVRLHDGQTLRLDCDKDDRFLIELIAIGLDIGFAVWTDS